MTAWYAYAFLFGAVFFAGFVDSVAGGGGLISMPAYLAFGLPPHLALGNNKFSSSWGTLFATSRYVRGGAADLPVALASAAFALAGSFFGTKTVLLLDASFLRYILVVLVPAIAALTLAKKNLGMKDESLTMALRKKFLLAGAAGLGIGFYDGFFGPGTGSFLILAYTLAMKYDFVTANANAKVVNLASNIAAAATFMAAGKVDYRIGIPAALCGIAGNVLGSSVVMKKGVRIIRPIFLGVLALLFAKMVWDLAFS